MNMSGRKIFGESEKLCLQKLIIKYKLNKTSITAAGSYSFKKVAWARLVEEYNSIASNSKVSYTIQYNPLFCYYKYHAYLNFFLSVACFY